MRSQLAKGVSHHLCLKVRSPPFYSLSANLELFNMTSFPSVISYFALFFMKSCLFFPSVHKPPVHQFPLRSHSETSAHQFQALAHLARHPSAIACPLAPERARWPSAALVVPAAPACTAHPSDQRPAFSLSGAQHPGTMKWSLIIKLKSLSAEQFK